MFSQWLTLHLLFNAIFAVALGWIGWKIFKDCWLTLTGRLPWSVQPRFIKLCAAFLVVLAIAGLLRV